MAAGPADEYHDRQGEQDVADAGAVREMDRKADVAAAAGELGRLDVVGKVDNQGQEDAADEVSMQRRRLVVEGPDAGDQVAAAKDSGHEGGGAGRPQPQLPGRGGVAVVLWVVAIGVVAAAPTGAADQGAQRVQTAAA